MRDGVDFSKTSTAGGGPIIDCQDVAYVLGDVAARIEACRFFCWKTPTAWTSATTTSECAPMLSTLTRVVVSVSRSRTKMSGHWPGLGNDWPRCNGASTDPDINGDGTLATFFSVATKLVANDTNTWPVLQVRGQCAVIFDHAR